MPPSAAGGAGEAWTPELSDDSLVGLLGCAPPSGAPRFPTRPQPAASCPTVGTQGFRSSSSLLGWLLPSLPRFCTPPLEEGTPSPPYMVPTTSDGFGLPAGARGLRGRGSGPGDWCRAGQAAGRGGGGEAAGHCDAGQSTTLLGGRGQESGSWHGRGALAPGPAELQAEQPGLLGLVF
ncbi:hypothetical protein PAL_GLEAN10020946 [Pteropus alecto]|uniref:Uncharacterized protein n=1 Tax=Pteropus alecto TaxID=9402 RepID=L5JPA2_PTEAL|nr:hypothetical protein PAL_GLEAN10020946 [Pteropus alecto]